MIRKEVAGIIAGAVLRRQMLVTSDLLLPCAFSAHDRRRWLHAA